MADNITSDVNQHEQTEICGSKPPKVWWNLNLAKLSCTLASGHPDRHRDGRWTWGDTGHAPMQDGYR